MIQKLTIKVTSQDWDVTEFEFTHTNGRDVFVNEYTAYRSPFGDIRFDEVPKHELEREAMNLIMKSK
jgi:hypothetical protein